MRDRLQAASEFGHHWRADAHLLGLCGEWCYAAITGQMETMNLSPEIVGLAGSDFPGVDVKAVGRQGHWLLANAEGHLKAPVYFGVEIDVDGRMAHPLGYATRRMVLDGPGRDTGYGRRRGLPSSALVSPDFLLSRLLRKRQGGDP